MSLPQRENLRPRPFVEVSKAKLSIPPNIEPAATPEPAPDLRRRIPMRGVYTEDARLARLAWARRQSGAALLELQHTRVEPERLRGNVENMIGTIEVPVGIAGPLLFRGQHAIGSICAPLATTEGAVVASTTRGATAVTMSGGVTTRVLGQRMMRVPLFAMANMRGAVLLETWLRDHVHELRGKVCEVSKHAQLISVEPTSMGRIVHVQFLYETADAAGQNMTTVCTAHACQWILDQLSRIEDAKVENFYVEANMSGDKKVTYRSFLDGRGTRVVADCVLERRVIERVLKTTPEQLMLGIQRASAGAISSGMIGFNINTANIVAAIFTATGQDIACVHESSLAQLHMEPVPEGIYATMLLPGLVVGTVGGGTHLPGQSDLLDLIDCAGPGKVARLAEIIAGFALALDLSTMAAIANGEFARVHDKMGRNRPIQTFERRDLGPTFFEPALRVALNQPELKVRTVVPLEVSLGSSIVTELSACTSRKLIGLFPLRVTSDLPGKPWPVTTDVIVKVKPTDRDVAHMGMTLAGMCGVRLSNAYDQFRDRLGSAGCHLRELAIYEQTDSRFVDHVPGVYRTYRDDDREAYAVVLESLTDVRLLDTADDPSGWAKADVEAALAGIARIHSIWLGRDEELSTQPWIGTPPSSASMHEMSELWEALAVHASEEFPELIGPARVAQLREFIRTLDGWWPELEQMPRTLIHNDFNPRNVALRDEAIPRLCAYDWELATLHVPQHDLAEFLCFTLPTDVGPDLVDALVETHRRELERAAGVELEPAQWRRGYALSLRDLAIHRFGLYLMAHTFRDYAFMDRTINTLWQLLDFERGREHAS